MATPGSSRKSVSDSETGSSSRQSTGGTIPDALSVEEHGRHWNAYREGKYLLPNDGDEQDRLDMQHKMWRMRLGGRLHLAPVKNSAHVLDIGTGTGIWALQFAAENPQSDVIGTDISMIQPTENLPPNCSFVREDSEEEWIFGKKFTYIHWRLMVSAFQDHRAMLQKVYENLLPDGWAEFHEWSCEFIGENAAAEEELRASALGQLAPRLLAGGASTGRDFQSPRNYKRWMLELGFVDVTEVQILTPVNGWPIDPHDRMMGSWACLDLLKLVRATTKILHAGGIPLEEIPYFQDQVCQCLTQRSMRVYSPSYIVYGRKPSPQHSSSASLLQEPLNN